MQKLSRRQWEQVQALFHEAVEQADCDLLTATDCDTAVAREAQRLIKLYQNAGGFLRAPGLPTDDVSTPASPPPPIADQLSSHREGDIIGQFQLSRKLNCGGMGEVWLAERADKQFKQIVAVKILRGSSSASSLARFGDEREALARLEHPSITRLIDGGITPTGEPYLVMEFVDGKPLDAYAFEANLGLRRRLRMFMDVCEAVEFAHQNLIVHCDLKPANILVSSAGRVRVLDFGVCRLLQNVGQSQAAGLMRMQAFTPDYASPEQIRGEPCTTSSDIYSLGLVLRRLVDPAFLPGARGLLTRIARSRSDPDAGDQDASQEIWSAESAGIARDVPADDLKWIIEKATKQQPQTRYRSARALMDDLECLLTLRPVAARPPAKTYRLQRWLQRNKVLATSIAVLLATIALGATGVVRAWRREAAEHQTALAATTFLEELLGSSMPLALQRDASSLLLLEEASRQAEADLAGRPAVELSVRMSLARINAALWKWEAARDESRRAVELARLLHGSDSEIMADALTILGRAQTWLRDPAAVDTQKACLAIREQLYPAIHPKLAEIHINLGFALWWTTPRSLWHKANEEYRTGIALFRDVGDSTSADFARALYSYVNFGHEYGLPRDTLLAMAKESVEIFERSPERPSRYSRGALVTYASVLADSEDASSAIPLLRQFLNLWGPEDLADPQVLSAAWLLAQLLHIEGDQNGALQWYKSAMQGECAAMAQRAGVEWSQSKLELERVQNSAQLLFWIHRSLLPKWDACEPDQKRLMLQAIWPVLLAGREPDAETVVGKIVDYYASRCAQHDSERMLLTLALDETRLLQEPTDQHVASLEESTRSLKPVDGRSRLAIKRALKTLEQAK